MEFNHDNILLKAKELAFDALFKHLPLNFSWMNRDGILLGCNETTLKNLSLTHMDEFVGKHSTEVATLEAWNNSRWVMETNKPSTFEETHVTPEGKKVVFLSIKSPLHDEAGSVTGMVAVAIDITVEKEKEHIKDLLIHHSAGHLYWKDREGAYLGINQNFARTVGAQTLDVVTGKTDYDYLDTEAAQKIRENDLFVMESGQKLTTEEIWIDGEGKPAPYFSEKSPLRDKNNCIIGIIGSSINIAAQKEAEQLKIDGLIRENAIEHEKVEAIEFLASSIAHELRTPLASIGLATANLEEYLHLLTTQLGDTLNKGELADLLRIPQTLRGEKNSALSFIEMLLINIQNLNEVNIQHRQAFSLIECVEEALERYPFQPGQRQQVSWQPQQDVTLNGQKLLMVHVLFNLLKNSLYFIHAAGKGHILITLESDQHTHRLLFKDTGAGISADALPHIFDRFFSAKTHHGSGIGLAFCKMVVESHGGEIVGESVPGEYTLFTISFAH